MYPKYYRKPSSLQKAVDVSVWLLKTHYLPSVDAAFKGKPLKENEVAAALSFHWNTGRIQSTDWVDLYLEDQPRASEEFLRSHYTNRGLLAPRRDSEADLFFHGEWPSDMRVPIYPVSVKDTPLWGAAKKYDLTDNITAALKKA